MPEPTRWRVVRRKSVVPGREEVVLGKLQVQLYEAQFTFRRTGSKSNVGTRCLDKLFEPSRRALTFKSTGCSTALYSLPFGFVGDVVDWFNGQLAKYPRYLQFYSGISSLVN
jgi:hypothetical protein